VRKIVIPWHLWDQPFEGTALVIPVKVDWPELQLSEAQHVANAFASVAGRPTPYPDLTVFSVRLER
jgi:hypothetical protein